MGSNVQKDVERYTEDIKLLITYPAHVFQPIVDIANVVYNSFFDYGVEVELLAIKNVSALNSLAVKGNYSHILSINTHDYLEAEKEFYLDKPKYTCLMSYNLEQTPIEAQNSYWASMRINEVGYYGPYFDYIVSESICKSRDILNMGFRILHLNLPYHPCIDQKGSPSLSDKEYDIMFIGCGSERREHLIQKLRAEGLTFAPTPLPHALQKEYKANCVRKTRLCLNVHFSNMEYFEKPRLMYDLFVNKGVVVSEKILYPEVFTHMKDFYMAKYNNIVPLVMMLLSKYNPEIMQVGYNAYDTLVTKHHYTKLIPAFLEELYLKEHKLGRN